MKQQGVLYLHSPFCYTEAVCNKRSALLEILKCRVYLITLYILDLHNTVMYCSHPIYNILAFVTIVHETTTTI